MNKDIKQLAEEFSRFKKTVEVKLSVLTRGQRELQDSVNRMDRDLGEDRKDITDTKLMMTNLNNQMDEVRSLFNQQTQKIKETVKNAVEDRVEPVQDGVDQIQKTLDKEVTKK